MADSGECDGVLVGMVATFALSTLCLFTTLLYIVLVRKPTTHSEEMREPPGSQTSNPPLSKNSSFGSLGVMLRDGLSSKGSKRELTLSEEYQQKKAASRSKNTSPSEQNMTNQEKELVTWGLGGFIGSGLLPSHTLGGYGQVYVGMNLFSGELLAVKRCQLGIAPQSRHAAESLQKEILLLKELNHTNIVRYFGCTVDDECINLFMEYQPGRRCPET